MENPIQILRDERNPQKICSHFGNVLEIDGLIVFKHNNSIELTKWILNGSDKMCVCLCVIVSFGECNTNICDCFVRLHGI